jgi:hypothetical protein
VDDLVNWCAGDEGDDFLVIGLHGEGEWSGDDCDGSGS